MITFTYQFDQNGVWIHKSSIGEKESSTHYDNPKNAAEVCYLLLTGVNLMLMNNEECTEKNPEGDHNDLLKIAINYNYVKDQYPLFESVFYEEINLAILIKGGINE
jgi:hypothetical protein